MKTILVDAINCFVIEGEAMFREMYELLEKFPNQKIILTGADDKQFIEFGLDKMPYKVFTLKHDPDKSDPSYYKIMLDHFSLGKEDVIYFEHNLTAAKSAESVGIKTYHYDQYNKDLKDLKSFIDTNI